MSRAFDHCRYKDRRTYYLRSQTLQRTGAPHSPATHHVTTAAAQTIHSHTACFNASLQNNTWLLAGQCGSCWQRGESQVRPCMVEPKLPHAIRRKDVVAAHAGYLLPASHGHVHHVRSRKPEHIQVHLSSYTDTLTPRLGQASCSAEPRVVTPATLGHHIFAWYQCTQCAT